MTFIRDEAIDPTEVGEALPVPHEHMTFLEKVMMEGDIPDPYDARDLTEVVFRVMRDLMTGETIEHVESELHQPAFETKEKAMQMEVADLWKDTNPIVGFLSRIRQPLRGPAPIGIDSTLFLTRVANEGGLTVDRTAEQVVKAVFSATKDELSEERIQEIAGWMPEGAVRQLWETA